MAVPGDRERLVRLETRAREADIALRQLKSYVQLLKQKADDPQAAAQEAECERVEAENTRLSAQVAQLKQKLVELEVRNGIEQAPHPKPAQLSYNVAGIAPLATASGGDASPALNGANEPQPLQSLASLATEGTAKGKKKAAGDEGEGKKKEKKEKKDKKAGGGEGAGGVDVSRLDFKIGRIISVERHPDADSLYVEQIDIGEDKPRTVCSGLVAHVAMEDMNDRLVIVLCNLKPVKMRGVVSEAMVMCASSPEKVEILDPPGSSTPGERIDFEGYTGQPDSQLNPKKKIFEQIQPDFLVNDKGVATYRGTPFAVGDKGVCRAATMRGSGIK